jgi:antitoxin component YwqK of YwqJK toxin-antitoxin module
MEEAFWDKGPPPILRFRGEKVYWDGEWVNDGLGTFYDEMGRVVAEGSFKLGKESGPWALDENGFRAEGSFVDGQRHGEWSYKYPSGKVQESGVYNMGKREGEWRGFYSNGSLKILRVYVDGVLKGSPETWDVEGHRN